MNPGFGKFYSIFLQCLCLTGMQILFIHGSAQQKEPVVSVQVLPDHDNWIYKQGEPVIFSISVFRDKKPVKDVKLHCEIGQEKMQNSLIIDTILKIGTAHINGGSMKQPGFLRCIVSAEISGKTYKALATAAFDPGEIKPTVEMPDDFSEFWRGVVNAARKNSLDTQMKLLPERSRGAFNVYEVSFQNERKGSRIYGILCRPKKPGLYPAILKVPGAGVRPYFGDTVLAKDDIITLEIGIHGIPVSLPRQVYLDLAFGPLREYYFSNLDSRDAYYYKRVISGCIRSLDFLCSLEQTDTSRIAVYGGSQGGALSIITASLDRRVKFLACLYPALSDLTGYFQGRAGGWPHMFAPSAPAYLKSIEKVKTAAYYDAVNFAKQLKVPGIYLWGFNDEVCPPTSFYAVHNSITAPRETFISKESGHWLTKEQEQQISAWLLKKLHP